MQNKFKNKKNSGFTLMETLFGLAIFILIVGALTLFSKNIWNYNSFISNGLIDTNSGRKILKTMVSEIRTASTSDTGTYVINQAGTSSFTFYSNIDSDALKEKVRYFLSGTTLQKGITKPTGSPLSYNTLNEKISILAENVQNTAIFEYFDKNYDGNTSPLSFPVNIPDIRLIKITITIDKDTTRPPAETTISTQVSLRNLKDNL